MCARRLAAKQAAKYSPELESQARGWIEACIGEELGPGSFHDVLKSGVALCSLVRVIQPDIIKAPSKLAAPFKQMENIGNYLSACTKLGVSAHDSFQTVDLFEGKNMVQVINQIHRLGSVAASRGFQGPALGVKMATANAREFTEEQMRAGLNTQTFMGAGSNDTAGAKLSMVETGRVQVRGNVAGTEGLGKGGEQTFIGTGSQV